MNTRRALVAEDSAHILFSLEMLLEQSGVEIVGAAATVAGMRKLVETIDADVAILDVNLNGEPISPVADILIARGVPFVFATGYGQRGVPEPYRATPTLQKPFQLDALGEAIDAVTAG